jgi:hypothetical protein
VEPGAVSSRESEEKMDLLSIVVTVTFLALSVALVALCERLSEAGR